MKAPSAYCAPRRVVASGAAPERIAGRPLEVSGVSILPAQNELPGWATHVPGYTNPASIGDFHAWFATDADCLDYLEWLRWSNGFICPDCGQSGGWLMGDGRFECQSCQFRTSATADTIFDGARTPLTVWFTACWQLVSGKDGISAMSLKRRDSV